MSRLHCSLLFCSNNLRAEFFAPFRRLPCKQVLLSLVRNLLVETRRLHQDVIMVFMGGANRKRRSSSMPSVTRHSVGDDGRQTFHGWVDAGALPPKCRRVNMAVEVSHAPAAKRQRGTQANWAELAKVEAELMKEQNRIQRLYQRCPPEARQGFFQLQFEEEHRILCRTPGAMKLMGHFAEQQQKQREPSAEADPRNDPLRDQQQEPGQAVNKQLA